MKDHTSHDVLLLCPRCHQLSNASDQRMREKLALECDAPYTAKDGATKLVELPRQRELKSISRALLFQRHKIPEPRLTELRNRIIELCLDIQTVEDISDDYLKSLIDIETT